MPRKRTACFDHDFEDLHAVLRILDAGMQHFRNLVNQQFPIRTLFLIQFIAPLEKLSVCIIVLLRHAFPS